MESNIKTPVYKLSNIFLEFILVFLLISIGLLYSVINRNILFIDEHLNSEVVSIIITRSFLASIFFVFLANSIRIIIKIIHLAIPSGSADNHASKSMIFMENIFFALFIILLTINVRPVLQKTYPTETDYYLEYTLVRYDAIPTVLLLLIPGIILIVLILKNNRGYIVPFKIILIISLIVLGGYINNKANYDARVSETRANWITRDWEGQSKDGKKALEDAGTDEEKARAYYWLGVAENRQKNYEKAAEYQLKAIELTPYDGVPYSSLSGAYLGMEEMQKAKYYAEKCIELTPSYAWCYYSLANYYWVNEDIENAVLNAEKALDRDPNSPDIQQMYNIIKERENLINNYE